MPGCAIPVIEYLRDKVYLAAYDYTPEDTRHRVFFTVEEQLEYNPFHHDFGPLNIAHCYRFAVMFHEVLQANGNKAVVFYSRTDPRSRANAACLLASYMVLVQSWPPHSALAPLAQVDPPLMPFRDAGYSVADFILTVQDVVYGLWRAKESGLLDIRQFDLDEYENYELVENGDLSAIAPFYVAFASPQYDPRVDGEELPWAFNQVLKYFHRHDVKLVIRLNSHLYPAEEFERHGIKHADLIFDDGTCPTMSFVQGFLGAVEGVVREGGKVAVHCRAGLGRTGCLIGAHLIYTYGFTAQEVIAYMRFLRPGMVVGPQQHWLYQHQYTFREWRRSMRVGTIPDDSLAGYSPLVTEREYLREIRQLSPSHRRQSQTVASSPPRTPERSILGTVTNAASALPVPTPGQPRKSPSPRSTAPRPASRYQTLPSCQDTNSDDELENEQVWVPRQRRTVTDYDPPQSQQKHFARQLRLASNPSPRRRRQASAGSTVSSPARIGSVHK